MKASAPRRTSSNRCAGVSDGAAGADTPGRRKQLISAPVRWRFNLLHNGPTGSERKGTPLNHEIVDQSGGSAKPDGDGSIPNITPHQSGIANWEIVDIAEYLSSGFTPDDDVVGSSMAEVVDTTARLSDSDRKAIAANLRALPAIVRQK